MRTLLAASVRADTGGWQVSTRLLIGGAAGALCVAAFLSLSIGATGITLTSLPGVLSSMLTARHEADVAREQLVLIDIRLPRMLLGMFVGAALAVAGAMMQGMFRNPLADPGLVGVSSGAALAAVATIALGNGLASPWIKTFGTFALPVAAFLGGFLTTVVLMAIVSRQGQVAISTLLLAGIALAALNSALMGLIQYVSDDRELRELTLWTLGSLSGASWPKVIAIAPFAVLIAAVLPRLIRSLNGLLLGEAEAFHLGIEVERAKRVIVLITSAAVGAAVAVSGVLAFIGIVVPHVVRLLAGPDHRIVLPASALMGATLVLAADIFARMLVRPAELPLGIVMALLGAPLFLHMVVRRGMARG
jgi:iron complex transport system permease protein